MNECSLARSCLRENTQFQSFKETVLRGHPGKVQCTLCNTTFGIAHQGKRDVECHLEGSEDKRLAQQVNSCCCLTSFFPDWSSQDKVTNAEVLLLALFWSTTYHSKQLPMPVLSFVWCFQIVKQQKRMDVQQQNQLLQSIMQLLHQCIVH